VTVTADQRPASTPKLRHRSWSFWLGLLISLGCLAWAVQALNWPQVGRILTRITWSQAVWLVVGVGAILLSTLTRAWRWGALFFPDRLPSRHLLTAMLVGQTLNYFAPARAGDLARAYWLGDRTRAPSARALGTLVVEKLWDLLVVLVSLALLPLWLDLPEWLTLPARGLALFSLGLLLGILFSLFCRARALQLVERLAGRLPADWGQRVGRQVAALIDGLEGLRRGGAVWRTLFSTLAVWTWGGVAHLMVFWALGMSAPLTLLIFLSVVLRTGVAAPSLPASIGVYEGIIVACLAVFDISAEVAFSYGVLMHAVDFGPPILFTAILVWTERRPHSTLESPR
jgi:uncharacterized protein (TIRG00374 family)